MKRSSRVLGTASVWASCFFSSAHTLADDAPAPKSRATSAQVDSGALSSEAAAGAPSQTDQEQAATVAYQKALASYDEGDVAAALSSMRQSHQLSKRAELLYNIAQLEEELKACSDALEDYRRYLELVPQGRYRDAAERARARLERECQPPSAASTPSLSSSAGNEHETDRDRKTQPAVTPAPAPYWTTPRLIGWSAMASGTLLGVGAVFFTLEAMEAKNEFQQSVDNQKSGGPPRDTSLEDRQHRNQDLATVFAVTGGALIAGGALVLLLDPGKHEPRARSARLYAVPGLVGASYAQSF